MHKSLGLTSSTISLKKKRKKTNWAWWHMPALQEAKAKSIIRSKFEPRQYSNFVRPVSK